MDSTLDAKPTDPRDVFARVNEEIARAYEQIALADEQLSKMAHHAARHPPAAVKDGQVRGHRPSFGGRAVRAFTGLLLAACIGAAAIAWQSSYGDAAKEIVAKWAPQLVLTSSPPLPPAAPPPKPMPPFPPPRAAAAPRLPQAAGPSVPR